MSIELTVLGHLEGQLRSQVCSLKRGKKSKKLG